jgi:hypothetical protein
MIRRLGPLAVALILAALFAVGCGGDDNKSSGDTGSSTPAAATSDSSSTDSTATQDAGGSTSSVADNPQVKAAIEQCKQSIDANPQVSDDIKSDLKALCDKAASGDAKDVAEATKQVCVKIVESAVPAGDARDQALAACASATG